MVTWAHSLIEVSWGCFVYESQLCSGLGSFTGLWVLKRYSCAAWEFQRRKINVLNTGKLSLQEEELEFTIESLEADCGPNTSVSLDWACLFLNILKFAPSNGIRTCSLFFLLSPFLFTQNLVYSYPMRGVNDALGKHYIMTCSNPSCAWSSGISSVPWPSGELSPQGKHRGIYWPELDFFTKHPWFDLVTQRKELSIMSAHSQEKVLMGNDA